MTYDEWLALGQAKGWISQPECNTHEGLPGTPEEDAAWEEGYDPCVPAVRLWGEDGPPAGVGAGTVAE